MRVLEITLNSSGMLEGRELMYQVLDQEDGVLGFAPKSSHSPSPGGSGLRTGDLGSGQRTLAKPLSLFGFSSPFCQTGIAITT